MNFNMETGTVKWFNQLFDFAATTENSTLTPPFALPIYLRVQLAMETKSSLTLEKPKKDQTQ